jgi:hypothetical protein
VLADFNCTHFLFSGYYSALALIQHLRKIVFFVIFLDKEKMVLKQYGHMSKPMVHALRINLFSAISLPVIIVSVLIS